MLKLYNTLTREIDILQPQKNIYIYVCGITPYDTTHLGHAFVYISFDVLIRYLKYKGISVNYTQNVTDVNDRDKDILQRAKEQGCSWEQLSKFWTDKFLDDMNRLNWIKPNNYLFASSNIPSMIDLIKRILANGAAYEINGSVYLSIDRDKEFGKLSRLSEKEMIAKDIEYEEDIKNPDKKNPLDITLWRAANPNQEKHIPIFKSPFGPGRPGWHIECSAMAISSLEDQIDIHGGGKDLIFPHHESEIAQSEAGTGKAPFAKFWLHSGIVSVNGAKMSKSDKNLIMVSDLLKKYSANSIRFLLISNQFTQDWDFTENKMKDADLKMQKLEKFISNGKYENEDLSEFEKLMENNLNTPKVLTYLEELSKDHKNKGKVKQILNILGFVI